MNQCWATRWEVYEQIVETFNNGQDYDLDPCAEESTAKCDLFFTKEDDMFGIQDWYSHLDPHLVCTPRDSFSVFVNPEYGRTQPKFVEKLIEQIKIGAASKAEVLIPSRTETKLFHNTILRYAESITFYEGRLVFGSDEYWEFVWEQEFMDLINPSKAGQKNELYGKRGKFNAAPFPSMVVSLTSDSVHNNKTPLTKTLKAPKFYLGY